jgi:hypothetical protein
MQCEFFWFNTGMDEDQQNDASDMINWSNAAQLIYYLKYLSQILWSIT